MNKEQLDRNQPIVFRVLSNALKHNRLAHAYLFTGPKGSIKEDVALFFAQSLVCEHPDENGMACMECETCKRMEKEESIDFRWIHKDTRIKKKDIVDLQEFFTSTSQEKGNRRIYILEGFDNATKDAQNSLLKFLEEPSEGIYAILLADEKANVLSTIQSRTQIVTFKPTSKEEFSLSLQKVTNKENAQMLANNGYNYNQAMEWIENENFEMIKNEAKHYVDNWDSIQEIFRMHTEVFVPKSEILTKDWVRIWMQWILYFMKEREDMDLVHYTKIQAILVEGFDILRSPVDLALFLDKIYNQIRKVVIE